MSVVSLTRDAPQPSSGGLDHPAQFRLPGGLVDRARPLRFAFDGRAMTGLRRRYARLGASCQRRAARRALLQVPPPARHPRGRSRGAERARRAAAPARGASRTRARPGIELYRRARGAEPEPLALARLRPLGRQLLVRAVHQGRLLLQDLHVAGGAVGKALRAADPPRRRARPRRRLPKTRIITRKPSPSATCW